MTTQRDERAASMSTRVDPHRCRGCGYPVPLESRCPECGRESPVRYGHGRCRSCGYEITPGGRCSECGAMDAVHVLPVTPEELRELPREVGRTLLANVLAPASLYAMVFAFWAVRSFYSSELALDILRYVVLWLPLTTLAVRPWRSRNRWFLPRIPGAVVDIATILGVACLYWHTTVLVPDPRGDIIESIYPMLGFIVAMQVACIGALTSISGFYTKTVALPRRSVFLSFAMFATAACCAWMLLTTFTFFLFLLGASIWAFTAPAFLAVLMALSVAVSGDVQRLSLRPIGAGA